MKNQFKKSLSLIMAVLMLMSCWVWVAPTEAEAATPSYPVKIKYAITNECEGGGHIQIKYWNFNADGTVNTSSSGTKDVVSSLQGMAETTYEPTVQVPGFPYQILIKTVSVSAKNSHVALKAVTIGNRVVTNDFDNYEVKNAEKTLGIDANGNKSGDMWGKFTPDWPFPKFGLDESNSTTSLDITTIPGSATANFVFKDVNYDVAWPHTVTQNTPSVVLKKDGATKSGMSASKGSGNSTTVSAASGADQYNPGNSDSEWTLKPSFTSGKVTVTPSVDVILTHPQYTITFDGNGGKLDASDAGAISGHYGTPIGHYPTMYDYKGNQLAGFSTSKTGGTVLGEEAFKATTITGNQTYYARWESADVEIVFLTADGQTVCTFKDSEGAKYGKTLLEHFGSLDAINNKIYNSAVGFAFNGNQLAWSKDGIEYEFAGWRIIDAWDLDGNKITTLNGKMYDAEDATLQGKTAFQATYRPKSMKKYTVQFFNTNGVAFADPVEYNYGDAITNQPAAPSLAEDVEYTYTFAGWAKRVNANSSKYYTVDENGNDINGSRVLYVPYDIEYFAVEGNAEYVPVFKRTNKEYTITYNYYENKPDGSYEPKSVEVPGVYYGAKLEAPDEVAKTYTYDGERHNFSHWEVKDSADVTGPKIEDVTCTGNMTVWMTYAAAIPAVYTINFYDYYGNLINKGDGENQYAHGTDVEIPTWGDGEGYDIPSSIDTDYALYTFSKFATNKNGDVVTTAGADASYYAKYTEKLYATVTYYNEGVVVHKTDAKANFVDGVIPAYEVIPEKAEDPKGTYKFTRWVDSTGAEVTPGTSTFTSSDVKLYAEYKTTYKNYTVKFMNENVLISENTYHYGDPIVVPSETPTKAEDDSYTYEFRAWSPDVSEVCYGDVTYTATYRNTPKYYAVTWFEDNKKTSLLESHYMYGAKIQPAVMKAPKNYPDAGTGFKWVFDHWVQCDVNGNDILVDGKQVIFARGMKMPADHIYFYPVFVKEANTHVIKFKLADGSVAEVAVKHGAVFAEIAYAYETEATPAANEATHNIFDKWINSDGTDLSLGVDDNGKNTLVIGDMTVEASYKTEAHNKQIYEVIQAPTCTETGIVNKKCVVDTCDKIDYDVIEPMIPDNGKPNAQIVVGSTTWTLADFSTIDYTDVKVVGPDTYVLVNAQDTNTWSKPWNLDGSISRGVGKIDYYIHEATEAATTKDPETVLEADWTNVYSYGAVYADVLEEVLLSRGITEDKYYDLAFNNTALKNEIDNEVNDILATYNANATGILSDLELVDGKEYVIYIRVSDREVNGESNKSYLSSGTISYGSVPADIIISGEGYGSKFCEEADIRIVDDNDELVITLDGEDVEAYTNPGTTSANGTFVASFKVSEPGRHTVTVVDKNGNESRKNFEIKGGHTNRNYTVAATCEKDGSRYDLCIVCGAKGTEKVLPAAGHSFTVNYTDVAAKCLEDGSRTYVCDNNCGTKITVRPTTVEGKLAEAEKYDYATRKWVALTDNELAALKSTGDAADLSGLKSTGEHTYAKVKDANGEDTAEDAWVIDTAATCSAVGSKHKDCTVCGVLGRVTEEIEKDLTNGHKFLRASLTTKPTCTEKGEKTRTCRHCGYSEHVSYVDALGHKEGDYRINVEPVCQAGGNKILTCATCGEDIGDYVDIPALGCAWKLDGEVKKVENKTENGEIELIFVQYYKCSRCGETKKEILEDYVEPKEVTVTFMNGKDDATPVVIKKFVGETITADALTAPKKASDKTYSYTFSCWKDAVGKEVKFPIEVTADATYYADFTSKYINYTITYYQKVEKTLADGSSSTEYVEFKKTGYLHNGEEVELISGPSKASDWEFKYTFASWNLKDNEAVKYNDKLTIDGANIELVADYTSVKQKYAVTFAYSSSNIIESFEVEAGSKAECVVPAKQITKDYDSKRHYTFKEWNKASDLSKVKNNIYTTPVWNDADVDKHSFTKTEKSPATCAAKAVYTYACACGYSYDKEEGTALGHDLNDGVYVDGELIKTCQREGCGETVVDTSKFTVKFFVNAEDTEAIKTINYVPWGSKIDTSKIPADVSKDADSEFTYKFKGWALEGTTEIVNFTDFVVNKDCKFVAVFDKTARKYNVIFRYDGGTLIKTFVDVTAGTNLTTEFTEADIPKQAYNEKYHYVFSGWRGYEEGKLNITVENIQSTVQIVAEFDKIEHTYTANTLTEASCTNGTGTRYECTCGHYYDVTGKPLPHDYEVVKRVEATETTKGYIEYKCKNCTATKTEDLIYNDDRITISVSVAHNGAAQSGVKVEIQPVGGGESIIATTNANGVATFKVEDGVYACWVEIDGEKKEVSLESAGKGNLVGTYSYTSVVNCTCACHRDNIWGSIFRFFHKIIKLFTGEFKCCTNPDPMYG